MDRIIVTSILIIAAITSAAMVVFSLGSSTQEDTQITANIQDALGDQIRTKIQIISATADPQGTSFSVWAKNIGSVDIEPIPDTDVFLERIDNRWGAAIPHSEPQGLSWSVQPGIPDNIWKADQILQLVISIPANADPGYPTDQRFGAYQVMLVTPNGVHDEKVFEHNPWLTLLTVASPVAGGALTGGGVYASGTTVTVIATPSAGFTFDRWSGACSGAGACTVTMDSSKTVTANFSQRFALTTVASPVAGGALTGGGTYASGTTVTVTATPNPGYIFDRWFGACTGTGACNITIDADKTVTANFLQQQFALTTVPSPTAGGSLTGGGVYPWGAMVTVTATPSPGFIFDRWSGACTGSAPCTVTMDAAKAVTANFSQQFALTTVPSPTAGGSLTGGGVYPSGATASVTAFPSAGFTFDRWSGACSGSGPCNPTMDRDKTVTANFTP